MKKLAIALVLTAGLAACGSDDEKKTPDNSFPRPTGYIAANLTVDDSANKVYTAGDLKWKGAFIYDSATRIATYDSSWAGGDASKYPLLYDDGAWNTVGGHEPSGATAGDNKWGVAMFMKAPTTGSTAVGYGLMDAKYAALPGGDGWLWVSSKFEKIPDGSFAIPSTQTADINATPKPFPAFGNIDIKFTLTVASLAAKPGGGSWDTANVYVKSSAWGWNQIKMTCASGVCTATLSDFVGAGKTLPRSGLLKAGDKPEFGINLCATANCGTEYRNGSDPFFTAGIGVEAKVGSGAFGAVTISNAASGNLTYTAP